MVKTCVRRGGAAYWVRERRGNVPLDRHAHQPPNRKRTDRTLVNAAAEAAPPVLRLDDNGLHRYGDADAVFALLARDCLDLFDNPDRAALRWCADGNCTRAFVDRSRGQRRRWCGMKGCGDRAKAAAYRSRRASVQSPGNLGPSGR
jgi:predicted RNA-binding Zn ribbon-like protein